ncbi:hypothetical protein F4808DRAFT_86458 [Astrocystis sublimbata]|nr:hypothetical protein F4808DRAFT_86458 [Astrocystis sublimbata]
MVNGIAGSWIDSGTTLAEPLPKNSTAVKAVIIQGDDGSKHLYTFDLSALPNTVNRTVLVDGNGAPVLKSAPIKSSGAKKADGGKAKGSIDERDLLATNWPSYNSTFQPKSARSEYSLAADSNGLVVMSGGDDKDVLCMFNAKANNWKDVEAVLGAESISIQSTPSTDSASTFSSSSTSSATSEATSTSAPPAMPAYSKPALPTNTIIGIALGVIFGVAILLALILFLLKRRQRRRSFVEIGHARRASGIPRKTSSTKIWPRQQVGSLRVMLSKIHRIPSLRWPCFWASHKGQLFNAKAAVIRDGCRVIMCAAKTSKTRLAGLSHR